MTVEDQLKSSFYKSLGMLSVVPPVVATGITLKVVSKTFKDLEKDIKKI